VIETRENVRHPHADKNRLERREKQKKGKTKGKELFKQDRKATKKDGLSKSHKENQREKKGSAIRMRPKSPARSLGWKRNRLEVQKGRT